ncbi:hypothetical protein BKA61DRAFT_739097 [Leptodontidium sp. MPI-SDFR-AT-0119]|nr:hypothetical protein BKA61DRAFT_739097 [Leptodontidium sp. MPI-SDFR-AT-0119]
MDKSDVSRVLKGTEIKKTCYGGSCTDAEESVSTRVEEACTIFNPSRKYCCPKPALLCDCTWRGSQPDCPDAKCKSDEVAIDLNPQGSGILACSWSPKKTDCSKVRSGPQAALTCDMSICDADPALCGDTASIGLMTKRDFFTLDNGLSIAEPLYTDDLEPEDEGDEYSILEKRKKRSVTFELLGRAAIIVFARPHPSRSQLFASALRLRTVIRRFFHLEHTQCDGTAITGVDLPTPNQASTLPRTGETEHPIDLSIHKRFVRCAERGILPDCSATENPGLGAAFFADQYLAENMLRQGLPLVTPNSAQYRSAYMRVWEAFGSTTNAAQFVLTDRDINGPKGRVMNLGAIGVFKYLQNTDVAARFQNTRDLIRERLEIIEAELPGATGLVALWDECFEAILREIKRTAQEWLLARVNQARQIYTQVRPTPWNRASVFTTLTSLERQIMSMYIPGSR